MDRHEEKEVRGKKERLVAHFSEETPQLCIHTARKLQCCTNVQLPVYANSLMS